jgi:hypothetical protein
MHWNRSQKWQGVLLGSASPEAGSLTWNPGVENVGTGGTAMSRVGLAHRFAA